MTFLIFWTVVGVLAFIAGCAMADPPMFHGDAPPTTTMKLGKRIMIVGLMIFLVCGSLAALSQDLVS